MEENWGDEEEGKRGQRLEKEERRQDEHESWVNENELDGTWGQLNEDKPYQKTKRYGEVKDFRGNLFE